MQAKAARTRQIVEVLGSIGTMAYARLDRCSKVAEEWAAESMAGVAMRRSRRASACRRGSTPSGCRNGSARRRNFWTPSASCFPARRRADPKVLEGRYAARSRRTGGPCLVRTCRDLYSRSRCRSRPNLGNVLDWEHLPALHEMHSDHVRLVETGSWGWRVELTKAAGQRAAMEQRVDWVNARYCARTFAGNGAGAEIWTLLEAARTAANGSLM